MAETSHIFSLYNLWNLWNESIAPNILHWCWYSWRPGCLWPLPTTPLMSEAVLTYRTVDWSNQRGGNLLQSLQLQLEFLCPSFGSPDTEFGAGLIPQSLCFCHNTGSSPQSCPCSSNPHQPLAHSLFSCHGQKTFSRCHIHQQNEAHTANTTEKVFLQGEMYSNRWATIL